MVTTREKLMAKLEKAYPNMFLRTTEEFSGSEGGIWTSGEESPEDKAGLPLFDYYTIDNEEKYYIFGVRVHLHNFLERNGWYGEWHDCGTMMLWKA